MKRLTKGIIFILVLCFMATTAVGCTAGSINVAKAPLLLLLERENENHLLNVDDDSINNSPFASQSVTVEQKVVFDQNGIKITLKGIDSSLFGQEIKFLIENNSAKSITVSSKDVSVNGYMVNTLLASDVAAGKKANDSMTILSSELEKAGIDTIADIELRFHIYDSNSWDTIIDSDFIRIETSAATDYTYTFDNSGNQIYNDKGIEIVVKGLSESIFGSQIVLYISNTSKQNITVSARDVSINGFMVTPLFSCDVTSGKHAVDAITFLSSDFEENDIESIENMEISFHIYDMDTWDNIADSSPITIDFE